MFPNAVISDNQNPRTPIGRCVGDIASDTLNRISEILRSLFSTKSISEHVTKISDKREKFPETMFFQYPICIIGSTEAAVA